MRLRVNRSGRRSAWISGVHHGEAGREGGAGGKASSFGLGTGGFDQIQVSGGTETLDQRLRPGPRAAALGRMGRWNKEEVMVKVIASSLRKGNVVEQDNKLYVILKAENVHPGKGNSVTNVDMRRISDGVKVAERWRTIEMVEKADVDEREYQYLYEDSEGFHFMEPQSYEQIAVSADVVGEQSAFLADGMLVYLKTFNGVAIAIELPARVTLEITDTEPVVKGQTASSSFKPATLSNGVKTMVPPHIGIGTRVVVMTDDGSYVERSKD
jgi:elongation factor P